MTVMSHAAEEVTNFCDPHPTPSHHRGPTAKPRTPVRACSPELLRRGQGGKALDKEVDRRKTLILVRLVYPGPSSTIERRLGSMALYQKFQMRTIQTRNVIAGVPHDTVDVCA